MIFTKSAGQPSTAQNDAKTELARFRLPRTEIIVRLAQEADLLQLEWHGGEDLRGFYRELWNNHVKEAITMVVADFNDFPIGLAAIYWHGKTTHPHIPDLQSLRVLPLFRRMGIGSRLLEACEEYSRSREHKQISLSVSIENDRARRLYERSGYVVTREPYLSVWDYCDAAGKDVRVEETVLDMVKTFS